jgi:alpha-tubulin suppressor-like RCC1 family protein
VGVSSPIDIAISADNACARIGGNYVKCWGSYETNYPNFAKDGGELPAYSGMGSFTAAFGNAMDNTNSGTLSLFGAQDRIFASADALGFVGVQGGTNWLGWGNNQIAQLGLGHFASRSGPELTTLGVGSLAKGTLSKSTGCVLNLAGSAYCWGNNPYGQVGDGTTMDRISPTLVAGGFNFIDIGTSLDHTCGLTATGTVKCWGENGQGELGNGTLTASSVPVSTNTLTSVKQIAVGPNHNCALKTDGTVWCWGRNQEGQLGDHTNINRSSPAQTVGVGNAGFLQNIVAVRAGRDYTCAIDQYGKVYCWGEGSLGQLGENNNVVRFDPVQVKDTTGTGTLPSIIDLATGYQHACATNALGNVYCWGSGGSGQIGNGANANRSYPTAVLGLP